MIDKVQKIREEVERIQLYTQSEVLKKVLDYIDEVQKEPVSDDLEKVAKEYSIIDGADDIEEYARYDIKKYNSFKDGAQWQKKQDMAVIKMTKELLEDFDKHCDEYHEAGFKHGQEALMKDAIDAKIGSFTNGTIYDADFNIDSNLKDNDKVKVIVIKED